uniref:Uncharacterized protein n=1 Tax=Aegilops tauschii TaxID=37682 RepID=M8B5N4_AEGTA
MEQGTQIHGLVYKRGFEDDIIVAIALIDMYWIINARRTSVNGMSKLLRGSGLVAMIVLMTIETIRSLKPESQMLCRLAALAIKGIRVRMVILIPEYAS